MEKPNETTLFYLSQIISNIKQSSGLKKFFLVILWFIPIIALGLLCLLLFKNPFQKTPDLPGVYINPNPQGTQGVKNTENMDNIIKDINQNINQ